MHDMYTKAVRREFRELAGVAYERELSKALGKLEASFQQWRAGKIDVFELSDRIHAFHQGPNRQLYNRFVVGRADLVVAGALNVGLLRREELSPEALEAIGPAAEAFAAF